MIPALLTALGLVFVIEGLLYALVPGQLKNMLRTIEATSDENLRMAGAVAIGFGVLVVWLTRAYFGG
jgi:uncharacterized protein